MNRLLDILSRWLSALSLGWRRPHTPGRRSGWMNRQLAGRSWQSPGLILPTVMVAALLLISGVMLLAARNLSSWFRGVSSSDLSAARDAAEYGFNEIVGQLNTDDNAYLLVTKGTQWQTIAKADLDSCQVNYNAMNLPSANRIAGVASNSSNASQNLPNNSALSYTLTSYTEPALPPGQTNTSSGACYSSTSGDKFGNIKGGSGTLEVKGMVKRNGTEVASYILKRVVHVKWPSDSLANPILFLGLGSKLNYLDGNMCTTTDTAVTSCAGLPRTTLGCINLDDCLVVNVDSVSTKTRASYCADKKVKKYRKGVICNDFQQASDVLPAYPRPQDFGDSRTTTSDGWLRPPDVVCENKNAAKYFTDNSKYSSSCVVTTYTVSGGVTKSTVTKGVSFNVAPFTGKSAPASSSSLSTTLVPGCSYNSTTTAPATSATATAITCVYGKFTTKSDEMYWITSYASSIKKSRTVTSPALPLNLFINKDLDLSEGGFNNNSVSNWQNMRIFGLNTGATLSNGTPDCTSQKVLASTKKGIGIDGAFLWLPNATITYQSAAGKSAAYLVSWVCQFNGPTSGKSGDYWIVNPLPRRGINAGLKAGLAGYGANINATTYRAYGVSAEL